MITEAGRPLKIDLAYFRSHFGDSFPALTIVEPIEGETKEEHDKRQEKLDSILQEYIDAVYDIFYGIPDFWSHMERKIYEDKTRRCYGLLVAWYITDVAPKYASGVTSSGGIPIYSKKIGGVEIKFDTFRETPGSRSNTNLLKALQSNVYGNKAYLMIKAASKVAALRR